MKKLMFLVFVLGTISTASFAAASTGENLGLEECLFANQDQRAESEEISSNDKEDESAATQSN